MGIYFFLLLLFLSLLLCTIILGAGRGGFMAKPWFPLKLQLTVTISVSDTFSFYSRNASSNGGTNGTHDDGARGHEATHDGRPTSNTAITFVATPAWPCSFPALAPKPDQTLPLTTDKLLLQTDIVMLEWTAILIYYHLSHYMCKVWRQEFFMVNPWVLLSKELTSALQMY